MAISRLPRFLAGIGNLDPSQPGGGLQPELADVARLARRLVQRAVAAARTQDAPVASLLRAHLGPRAAGLPVASGCWPAYEHVNLQLAVDTWLSAPGRTHDLTGITWPLRQQPPGLADLLADGPARGMPAAGAGSVRTVALAAGPGGVTRSCVEWGLYLVTSNGQRLALLLRPGGPGSGDVRPELILEVAGPRQRDIDAVLAEIRQLAVTRSVFRGQVIAFGADVFGPGHAGPLTFLDRPAVPREQVILPSGLLSGIEAQVLGIARHARQLQANGQHLKRGILLHGPPGTGKTHTVRYLLGQLPGRTVVVVTGEALQTVREACAVARALQPSVVVVEDVDLIAEDRGAGQAEAHPLLFQLLNEMDGLAADADVTFLLTTNRVDLLEPALAERPGRVDHAARLPLPDAPARRRLLRLYRGSLHLDLAQPEAVISRTDGVTASFMKELLRRAALRAAADGSPDGAGGDRAAADETAA
ncbi:MAG: 26S protease regulatory subunit, partial [Actinobacteria bacterium]|nr:26S protease regulatory subunit [Actinomycetota bacterium]